MLQRGSNTVRFPAVGSVKHGYRGIVIWFPVHTSVCVCVCGTQRLLLANSAVCSALNRQARRMMFLSKQPQHCAFYIMGK